MNKQTNEVVEGEEEYQDDKILETVKTLTEKNINIDNFSRDSADNKIKRRNVTKITAIGRGRMA